MDPRGSRFHAPPVLALGASTGGPRAVASLLAGLPVDLAACVLLVQHLEPSFSADLVRWLAGQTRLKVALARQGDRLAPGTVFVAGDAAHLLVGPGPFLRLDTHPADALFRPSIDQLFESLAASDLPPGVAVLLTGMGSDGAAGLASLKRVGWLTIAQDEATSAVYGMPKAAAGLDAASLILPLEAIAARAVAHLRFHA